MVADLRFPNQKPLLSKVILAFVGIYIYYWLYCANAESCRVWPVVCYCWSKNEYIGDFMIKMTWWLFALNAGPSKKSESSHWVILHCKGSRNKAKTSRIVRPTHMYVAQFFGCPRSNFWLTTSVHLLKNQSLPRSALPHPLLLGWRQLENLKRLAEQ